MTGDATRPAGARALAALSAAEPPARSYAGYVAAAAELERLTPADTGLPPLRIAVLRNFTVEPLVPVLAGEAYLSGFHPQVHLGDFDAVGPGALAPESGLYAFGADIIIVAQWLETLSPALTTAFLSTSPDEIARESARVRTQLRAVASALRANARSPVLVNNFPLPAYPTLGILDSQSTAYQTHAILQLNAGLRSDASAIGDVSIVDFMRLFALHGSVHCVDERYWQMARAPLAREALVPIGREYGTFFRALRGKAKKCLVVDCDNTLWGGIVGEDGPAGIALGGTYPGSCFVALQREILNLHDRGVILAMCSKNDEADVLAVLRAHPDSLLAPEHFAAWQINWDDKVTNLRRLADELNIGLDSMVFVDDNPFEANFVRAHLPEVTVLALPPDAPASYRNLLAAPGWFDTLTYTVEDRRKNAMYGENRTRQALHAASASLAEYLASLEIEIEIGPPSEIDLPRVSQLSQKTNQFNLTARRYTEGEVRALAASGTFDLLSVKLRDRVADLGLVAVAVLRYEERAAFVDALLMSCRAFGRGVEDALIARLVRRALDERGAQRLVGTFVPTAKNAMAAGFYARHGFTAAGAAGGTTWEYAGSARLAVPAWIRLRDGETLPRG